MRERLPDPGVAYRLLGAGPKHRPEQRVGCGVIDKPGTTIDHEDFTSTYWALQWILRGAGELVDATGRTWPLAAGDAFVRRPGERHTTRVVAGSGWREAFIDLGGDIPPVLEAQGLLCPVAPVWHLGQDPARLRRWIEVRRDMGTAPDEDLPLLYTRAQALVLEAVAVGRAPVEGDPVQAACRLLAEDPTDRDDLKSFCQRLDLDYGTFRKRFQRQIGLSPGQYRIRRRLERACALLQHGDLPIADIALQLGYENPFTFSRQFRHHLGISPQQYRRR